MVDIALIMVEWYLMDCKSDTTSIVKVDARERRGLHTLNSRKEFHKAFY